jgi:membrane protein
VADATLAVWKLLVPLRDWKTGMRWVWHLGGLSVRELLKRVWAEIERDDVSGRAAQLSFYFVLAMFPLLIFLSAVVGQVFAGNSEIYYNLLGRLRAVMPESAYQLVRQTVDEITIGASGRKLSFGLVATVWTASSGMEAVINGLNVAYSVTERRKWWKRRVVAIGLTLLLAFISTIALMLILFGGRLASALAEKYGLGETFGGVTLGFQLMFPPIFMVLMFALIYRYAPNVRAQNWQALLPGALVALVLWLAATGLFRLYLLYFNSYSKTYGSLGAMIVLMLWLYVSGAAILVGGEVNSEIRKAAAEHHVAEASENLEAPPD